MLHFGKERSMMYLDFVRTARSILDGDGGRVHGEVRGHAEPGNLATCGRPVDADDERGV